MDRATYWETLYATRSLTDVGWYEAIPTVSLRRVREAIQDGGRSLIDVGGGASTLVDHLVDLKLTRLAVLDISEHALDAARARLGKRADRVEWIVADIAKVKDIGQFDLWHDRALFHFLTDAAERQQYVALSERTVSRGGVAVMATFAPDGPEKCSGLPVCRTDVSDLADQCGPSFEMIDSERHVHVTPGGVQQAFVYASLRHVAEDRVLVEHH